MTDKYPVYDLEAIHLSKTQRRGEWATQRKALRFFLCLCTASVIAGAASGCGSNQATTTSHSSAQGPTTTTATASPSSATTSGPATSSSNAASPGDLKTVGTITESGSGTTVSEVVMLGPVGYGTSAVPPIDVLGACNDNFSTTIATTVFIRGNMSLQYSQGRLPIQVQVGGNTLVNLADPNGDLAGLPPGRTQAASYLSGTWGCGAQSLSLQPGTSTSYPVWIILPSALTNQTPQLSQSTLNSMVWDLKPILDPAAAPNLKESITGPSAAVCNGFYTATPVVLLPFAQLPFSASGGSCRHSGP